MYRINAGQRDVGYLRNQEEQLPKLYESYEVVGNLKPEIAEELGLGTDVKVIAGAGDNAAAAVGTGTVGDGQCNISLGTSVQSLYQARRSVWISTMRCIHLHMQTAIII